MSKLSLRSVRDVKTGVPAGSEFVLDHSADAAESLEEMQSLGKKISITKKTVDAHRAAGENAARIHAQQRTHHAPAASGESRFDTKTPVAVGGGSSLTSSTVQSVGASSSSADVTGSSNQVHLVKGKLANGATRPTHVSSAGAVPVHLGTALMMGVHTHDRRGFMLTAAHAASRDPFGQETAA